MGGRKKYWYWLDKPEGQWMLRQLGYYPKTYCYICGKELEEQFILYKPYKVRVYCEKCLKHKIAAKKMTEAQLDQWFIENAETKLGFLILNRASFPDFLIYDLNRRIKLRVELEVTSKNFKYHEHDPSKCDLIICLFHNWRKCPIDVLTLDLEKVEDSNGQRTQNF